MTHRSGPGVVDDRGARPSRTRVTAPGSSFAPRLITSTRGSEELSDRTALGPSSACRLMLADSVIDQPGRNDERYRPVPTVSESP